METHKAIKTRKTVKALANTAWDITQDPQETQRMLAELMELAQAAPFHYFSEMHHRQQNQGTSLLPWRCYSLGGKECRDLARVLQLNKVEAGKILQMLHTANAMVLVTWLPDAPQNPLPEGTLFEATLKNMEHIAAASAAIQNVLVGATSRNIPNYWSSGGVLRDPSMFDYLAIPTDQILLGALFLFPEDISKAEVVHGANRKDAGTLEQFWQQVSVD